MTTSDWKLIIEDDAGRQIVVPFARDVITIGRKEGNTIRLTERNVSRFHVKLTRENGHVLVEDLSSFNGIKLNGDRVAGRMTVADGDTIQIGDYHVAVRAQAALAEASTAQLTPMALRAGLDKAGTSDDEFAGDTQRWEPPAELAALVVGAPGRAGAAPAEAARARAERPTAEMRLRLADPPAQRSEDTVPMVAQAKVQGTPAPANVAATLENRDTERVQLTNGTPEQTLPLQASALTGLAAAVAEVRAEPTVRQVMQLPEPISVPDGKLAPTTPPVGDLRAPTSPTSPTSPTAPTAASPASAGAAVAEQTAALRPASGGASPDELALPRLVVINTLFAGSVFSLRALEQVIGRTDENDIVVEHRSISRNHAKIVREGDRVRILDLKSANGILVNGEEVEAQVLRSGDIIELGRVKLRFVPAGEVFTVSADDIERARIADGESDGDFEREVSISSRVARNPLLRRFAPLMQRANALFALALLGFVAVAALSIYLLGRDPAPAAGQVPVVATDARPAVPGTDPLAAQPAAAAPLPTVPAGAPAEAGPAAVPAAGAQDPGAAPAASDAGVAVAPVAAPPAPVPAEPPAPRDVAAPPAAAVAAAPASPRPPDDARPDGRNRPRTLTKAQRQKVVDRAIKAYNDGDPSGAVEQILGAGLDRGNDPDGHRVVGLAYWRLGKKASACPHLLRFAELAPGSTVLADLKKRGLIDACTGPGGGGG